MQYRYRVVLRTLLALVAVVVVLHVIADPAPSSLHDLIDQWFYSAVAVATALVCLLRAGVERSQRAAWAAFGLGLGFDAIGEIVWQIDLAGHASIPYPSLADAFYLATYPCLYLGLWLLIREQGLRFSLGSAVDGLITGLAVAAVASGLLNQALETSGGGTAKVLTDLAYPVFDLMLISFLAGILVFNGRRPGWQLGWIGVGVGAWALADGLYLYQAAIGTYQEGTPLDSLWLVGGLAIAAATTVPPEARRASTPGRSIVFPILASAAAIAILVWDHFDPFTVASVVLAALTLVAVSVRLLVSFADNRRLLDQVHREAATDSLTGLRNRRRLIQDMTARLRRSREPFLFAFFDLDGFKAYNDSFGHPAGDLLLRRLGDQLQRAVAPGGCAYRLGGDEFCVIVEPAPGNPEAALAPAIASLTESGAGFSIGASYGSVLLPEETESPDEALGIADRRMYATKGKRATTARSQSRGLLLRVMDESKPALREHLHEVAALAVGAARRLGCSEGELNTIATAAEMHDIGKIAIPDEVLDKHGPLDSIEWRLMRTHTLIGERILNAAPALGEVARLVRSSHEQWDGQGYPDGLAGEDIPLGSRLIYICDAYDAMTEDRPYSQAISPAAAMAELRRHAGTQFDPVLVEAVCMEIEERLAAEPAAARHSAA